MTPTQRQRHIYLSLKRNLIETIGSAVFQAYLPLFFVLGACPRPTEASQMVMCSRTFLSQHRFIYCICFRILWLLQGRRQEAQPAELRAPQFQLGNLPRSKRFLWNAGRSLRSGLRSGLLKGMIHSGLAQPPRNEILGQVGGIPSQDLRCCKFPGFHRQVDFAWRQNLFQVSSSAARV